MGIARRATVAGLAVLLAVAGCTPGGSDPLPTPPQFTSNATLVTNAQDPATLRDGGQLRIPVTRLPASWNPWAADATSDTDEMVDAVRPHYLVYDAAGDARPNPDFATAASATHDGRTVVTLDLNPKAVWGDGRQITADDWVASWRALSGRVPGVRAQASDWRRVADVRAGEGPLQVVLTFASVDPDWSWVLEHGPLPADGVKDAAAFNASWASPDSARWAGPFRIAHVDRMQGVVTLERNPRWWGARPRLDSVIFRTIQPEALPAAFSSNEFDLFDVGLSESALTLARSTDGVTVRANLRATARRLTLKEDDGPLQELPVRQAIVRAIDRDRLTRTVLEDAGGEGAVWSNHLLLTNQAGYTNQADATGLTYAPDQAERLLQDAGWVLGGTNGSIRAKNGRPLSLTLTADPGDAQAAAEASRITADLAAVGVQVRPVSGGGDLSVERVTLSRYPLEDAAASLTHSDSEKDLARRIADEPDPVARNALATQAAAQLWQQADTIPLYQEPQVVAVKNGLANVGADALASTSWTAIGWTR